MKTAITAFWCSTLCALTLCNANTTKISDLLFPEKIPEKQVCGKAPHHMRASVRYTTPQGIGYKTGYTTLEGFFAPRNFFKEAWLPFLDVRGHVFDNGRFAANTGLGLRYLGQSRVWGINSYYDYRNTFRQHYNQVSAGFESLGRIWDFRINGYLPVGKKQSDFSRSHYATFHGHNLLIRHSREYAMKGANAEAGIHIDHFKKAPLYFAGGPYYLTGKGETTWGGELRGAVDLFRYVRLEANLSYDHFFKWIGQAQISINVPFGRRNKVTRRNDNSCSKEMALQTRAMQRVDRFEIIPVGKQHITSPAIDPSTGQPWVFLFVNNTSSPTVDAAASVGTYENPYPTLQEAQEASTPGEIIYMFPGDDEMMMTGMDSGIVLPDGEMLLETSTTHPIPAILIDEVLRVERWLRQKLGSD